MEWNKLFTLAFLLLSSAGFAQIGLDQYIVYFSDKDNTPYSIAQPEAFLSNRSIQRRVNQGIAFDQRDLPIDPVYIQQVLSLGDIQLLAKMKWINAILIFTTDQAALDAIVALGNVDRLEIPIVTGATEVEATQDLGSQPKIDADYGPSLNQINQINGIGLHDDGFRGEGMWIGVLDGGFTEVPNAAVLAPLLSDGRVLGTYNFVDRTSDVFQRGNHGTQVLSIMAGFQIDSLIGTAPEASYLLLITEDIFAEQHSEEAFWLAGAAYADSVGVDVLNTSLGYTLFDSVATDYTYADMDGNTALITIGADIAASRGLLVVNSAGNSGNSPWYYIGAPADGDSVLAIGSVNSEGFANGFSSRGPSADGRVKPNVMAQGGQTVITDLGTGITTGSGTSFSGPVIAGMSASLWQAFPTATAWQVHQAIEASASLYTNPNDSMGYGIPDFELARTILTDVVNATTDRPAANTFKIYPNPFADGSLSIVLPEIINAGDQLAIWDVSGRLIFRQQLPASAQSGGLWTFSPDDLSKGYYVVELRSASGYRAASPLVVR